MDITDYYKPSEALELITKVLPNEDPELSLIDAIRMGPIRTWVFHKQGRLRLKFRLSRTLIPSGLWWNLSEDLTRGDLRDHSALRVELTAGRAHFLLVDGHREYLSGELQIHKAGFTRWLNGLEKLDTEEQADNANESMKEKETAGKIRPEDARSDQQRKKAAAGRKGGGRKPGSGAYTDQDLPLWEKMKTALDNMDAASPWEAAHPLAENAKGKGTFDSKRRRLVTGYSDWIKTQ